jgi:hypothetical protein
MKGETHLFQMEHVFEAIEAKTAVRRPKEGPKKAHRRIEET